MVKEKNIRDLSREALREYMTSLGEKAFRSDQVYDWIWRRQAASFAEMSNLSKGLRERLEAAFVIDKATIESSRQSRDGTVKYIFRLADGSKVEGVLIPSGSRVTACISSQAGCSLDCRFCATGTLDLKRNLRHYEIFDQVSLLQAESAAYFDRGLTNIVYMGMGEPLLNYRNVLESIAMITSPEGMGMSPRRITVSTAGIAKMIRKLGDDQVKFEFALSLHAANDEKRSRIMPINEVNSLEILADALAYFYEKTGQRTTLEYIAFKDFNDSLADADELAAFARRVPTKVNLIEYNSVEGAEFQNTTADRMGAFIQRLESKGIIVNVRRSRGKDIDGACGQLALKEN
jgi:23S rRNA (adenine2503-C2)-methyltransferase